MRLLLFHVGALCVLSASAVDVCDAPVGLDFADGPLLYKSPVRQTSLRGGRPPHWQLYPHPGDIVTILSLPTGWRQLGDPYDSWQYAKVHVKTGEAKGLMGWAAMQRDDGGRMFAPSEQCVAQLKLETQETDAQHAQVAAQQQQQVQTASAASSSALLQHRHGRKPNPLVPFGWTMGTFAFLMLLNYAAHVFTYRSHSIEYARQQARKELAAAASEEYTPLKAKDMDMLAVFTTGSGAEGEEQVVLGYPLEFMTEGARPLIDTPASL